MEGHLRPRRPDLSPKDAAQLVAEFWNRELTSDPVQTGGRIDSDLPATQAGVGMFQGDGFAQAPALAWRTTMTTNASALDDIRAAAAATGRRVLEARFYLSSVTRRQMWAGQNSPDLPPVMVSVNMQAAKHGTFGKATPSGQIEMSVANPPAAQLLDEAHLSALQQRGQLPVFRVFFVEETPEEGE
jgi:hypothetical protein